MRLAHDDDRVARDARLHRRDRAVHDDDVCGRRAVEPEARRVAAHVSQRLRPRAHEERPVDSDREEAGALLRRRPGEREVPVGVGPPLDRRPRVRGRARRRDLAVEVLAVGRGQHVGAQGERCAVLERDPAGDGERAGLGGRAEPGRAGRGRCGLPPRDDERVDRGRGAVVEAPAAATRTLGDEVERHRLRHLDGHRRLVDEHQLGPPVRAPRVLRAAHRVLLAAAEPPQRAVVAARRVGVPQQPVGRQVQRLVREVLADQHRPGAVAHDPVGREAVVGLELPDGGVGQCRVAADVAREPAEALQHQLVLAGAPRVRDRRDRARRARLAQRVPLGDRPVRVAAERHHREGRARPTLGQRLVVLVAAGQVRVADDEQLLVGVRARELEHPLEHVPHARLDEGLVEVERDDEDGADLAAAPQRDRRGRRRPLDDPHLRRAREDLALPGRCRVVVDQRRRRVPARGERVLEPGVRARAVRQLPVERRPRLLLGARDRHLHAVHVEPGVALDDHGDRELAVGDRGRGWRRDDHLLGVDRLGLGELPQGEVVLEHARPAGQLADVHALDEHLVDGRRRRDVRDERDRVARVEPGAQVREAVLRLGSREHAGQRHPRTATTEVLEEVALERGDTVAHDHLVLVGLDELHLLQLEVSQHRADHGPSVRSRRCGQAGTAVRA